jgi:hypothetical protein
METSDAQYPTNSIYMIKLAKETKKLLYNLLIHSLHNDNILYNLLIHSVHNHTRFYNLQIHYVHNHTRLYNL